MLAPCAQDSLKHVQQVLSRTGTLVDGGSSGGSRTRPKHSGSNAFRPMTPDCNVLAQSEIACRVLQSDYIL